MTEQPGRVASFAFLGDDLRRLGPILVDAFTHPWVASYQIGFGPPLVRANPRLVAALRDTHRGLDKLEAYLEHCVYDDDERSRLAQLHKRQLVRRLGPLEAEAVRRASTDMLDLSLRLHDPRQAPPAVREDMASLDVDPDGLPHDLSLDDQAARFWITLGDPRNTRLLHMGVIGGRAADPERALALELRVPAALRALYAAWGRALTRDRYHPVIDLGAPASVARVSRDGERR